MEENVVFCINDDLMREGSIMLLRFELANYACFGERIRFDFRTHDYLDTDITDASDVDNLKIVNDQGVVDVAGVFGSNGSGKTYLIEGLSSLLNILGAGLINMESGKSPKSHITYAFDKQNDYLMSEYELEFSVDKEVYLFKCGIYKDFLVYEEMGIIQDKQEYPIFHFRYYSYDELNKEYKRNTDFVENQFKHEYYNVLTKFMAIFNKLDTNLSVRIGKNTSFIYHMLNRVDGKRIENMFSDDVERDIAYFLFETIKKIEGYIYKTIYIENRYKNNDISRVVKKFISWPEGTNKLTELLKKIDKTIDGITYKDELKKILEDPRIGKRIPDKYTAKLDIDLSELININRKYGSLERKLKLSWESKGTRRFLYMMMDILLILHEGGVVLIDELDANFNFGVQNYIIAMFKSKKYNENNAQLIFNSQNHDILRNDKMRLDEFYLAYKESNSCMAHLERFLDYYNSDIKSGKSKPEDISFLNDYIGNRFVKIPLNE